MLFMVTMTFMVFIVYLEFMVLLVFIVFMVNTVVSKTMQCNVEYLYACDLGQRQTGGVDHNCQVQAGQQHVAGRGGGGFNFKG